MTLDYAHFYFLVETAYCHSAQIPSQKECTLCRLFPLQKDTNHKKIDINKRKIMNIFTIVLAFFLGGYVAESISTMTPEKMQTLEKNKKEEDKK